MTQDIDSRAIDALAEAWASMDGKLEAYLADKALPPGQDSETEYYQGYQCDAEEFIRRLRKRGFDIVPRKT